MSVVNVLKQLRPNSATTKEEFAATSKRKSTATQTQLLQRNEFAATINKRKTYRIQRTKEDAHDSACE